MATAYLNQVLYGYSKDQVDEKYICDLLPLMLTSDKLNAVETVVPVKENAEPETIEYVTPKKEETAFRRRKLVQNSLFWAIYETECPTCEFQTRANAEIEQRLNVVTELKKTPKRLKDTNSKLTIEQSQALLGSMLVAKEDKLEFCIAYAVYYNKTIIVAYEKTYRVFSPTVEIDLSDPENIILLYATKPDKQIFYEPEKSISSSLLQELTEMKVCGPLKTISNYKNPELYEIADKFGISVHCEGTGTGKQKARKKADLYDDIRVAIHIDMNFIAEQTWNTINKN
jgi:hypothetical protein